MMIMSMIPFSYRVLRSLHLSIVVKAFFMYLKESKQFQKRMEQKRMSRFPEAIYVVCSHFSFFREVTPRNFIEILKSWPDGYV